MIGPRFPSGIVSYFEFFDGSSTVAAMRLVHSLNDIRIFTCPGAFAINLADSRSTKTMFSSEELIIK